MEKEKLDFHLKITAKSLKLNAVIFFIENPNPEVKQRMGDLYSYIKKNNGRYEEKTTTINPFGVEETIAQIEHFFMDEEDIEKIIELCADVVYSAYDRPAVAQIFAFGTGEGEYETSQFNIKFQIDKFRWDKKPDETGINLCSLIELTR